MKNRLVARAAAILAIAALSCPTYATLMVTAAGTSDGFSLSTFISAPSSYYYALGAGTLSDGTIVVAGYSAGLLYKFNDTDNQTPANALQSVSFPGAFTCTTAAAQAYCEGGAETSG
jgi:hypothetical protein